MVHKRRIIAFALAFAVLLPSLPAFAASELTRADIDDILWGYTIDPAILAYSEYKSIHPGVKPNREYRIDASDFSRYLEGDAEAEPVIMTDYEGMQGSSVLTSENSVIEYEINIEQAGFYDISLLYYPIEGKSSEIQRAFFINGRLPYHELAVVEFPRIWRNSQADPNAEPGYTAFEWERDNQGNDLKPWMVEAPEWTRYYLYDSEGYISSHLSVYLEEGISVITINAMREPMLLNEIMLDNQSASPSYEEYKATHDAKGARLTAGSFVRIGAQNAARTSSQMLYPVQDASSPALDPSSPKLLLNNTLGGYSWRFAGQWAEWEFTVPETGYYQLGVNVRQNFTRGALISRRITINGEVPFAEMEAYGFIYSQSWRQETLADDNGSAYLFYLEAGEVHTIRFEAVLGQYAEIISEVRESIYALNRIYRNVIRLTGIAPDKHRDYQIERSLPEIKAEITATRDRLNHVIDEILSVGVKRGSYERVMLTMRDQLDHLLKDVERFPRVIDTFKANVRALGTWLNEAMLQPLQLDEIQFFSSDVKPKLENNTIFHKIWYELSRLFYSFVINYNLVGDVADDNSGDTIVLWVGSGRDQANIIKALIDESFTRASGVNVNVMLVDMSTLLQATLAGQGPDIAIQVAGNLPMNYGLRNAVADLAQFSDLGEILTRFDPSAMEGFQFEGATYALPENQTFPMLFYRKDILKELGLEVPVTWDDVKVSMIVLSQNQMEFGMLPTEQVFATILYQNGGRYYNDTATKSALDEEEGVNAFKIYTEFYTDYKFERETSAEERFRTGEAPMIIADYTTYNNFQVSAPDLKGMWGFAPVPGTIDENGNINNIAATGASACIIMNLSKKKEASWEFLKWWTSADTQIIFGREMESLMGSAARVPTANLEAFESLPWPVADYEALKAQFANIRGIPQVPGGYFSFRNINNAFYTVTTPLTERPSSQKEMAPPREELTDKVILINDEIRYKRIEFGLPLYEDLHGDND